jgi:hypothetical protein
MIVGSRSKDQRTVSRISDIATMSFQMIVATRRELSLHPAAVREKKLAAMSDSHSSAMDGAIADFPA